MGLLSTLVRRIVYGPLSENCLKSSFASPRRAARGTIIFHTLRFLPCIEPQKALCQKTGGGANGGFGLASHDFGTFDQILAYFSQAKKVP